MNMKLGVQNGAKPQKNQREVLRSRERIQTFLVEKTKIREYTAARFFSGN